MLVPPSHIIGILAGPDRTTVIQLIKNALPQVVVKPQEDCMVIIIVNIWRTVKPPVYPIYGALHLPYFS